MARDQKSAWTVKAVGVRIVNGQRQEKPLEEFTPAERRELAARRNIEALAAAGYVPVKGAAGAAG